jgi:hypothetical protein
LLSYQLSTIFNSLCIKCVLQFIRAVAITVVKFIVAITIASIVKAAIKSTFIATQAIIASIIVFAFCSLSEGS